MRATFKAHAGPPAPLAAGDPVAATAGDIACAPPARRTSSGCHHRDTSDLLVAGGYDAVLPLRDLQYECGQDSAYRSVYDPTWGRVKAITHPAVGDNEYSGNGCSTSGASGYFGYFGSAATPRQPSCRTACGGYYSYDLGTWHIVVLNTVQALHNAGAEIILNGHEHLYERFAAPDPGRRRRPRRHPPVHRRDRGQEPPWAQRHTVPQRPGPKLQLLRGAGPDATPDQLRLAVRVRGGPDLHRLGQPPLPLGRRPAHRRAGPCPA